MNYIEKAHALARQTQTAIQMILHSEEPVTAHYTLSVLHSWLEGEIEALVTVIAKERDNDKDSVRDSVYSGSIHHGQDSR